MDKVVDRPDSSIVRPQHASSRDASFSSYLRPDHPHQQHHQRRADESGQISIFDAAEYFKGLHYEPKERAASPRVRDLSSMARLSSVSSCTDPGNYRARSFHGTTPTASSSEVSWNSQTGLLQQPNPSFLMGPTMVNNTTRWGRLSPKWLIPGWKCPCSGKKSVQVEDRTATPKITPKMVDLGRSSSSNGTNYHSHSLYSARQNCPKISPTNGNFTTAARNPIGFSCPPNGNNSSKGVLAFTSNVNSPTTNGFTFPVLENPAIGVKKMFNVIAAPNLDPHRDSLEVYRPRSGSPRSRRASYEEETTLSDGSSDLFEIDTFSTPNFNPNNNNNNIKRMGGPVWREEEEEETINGGDDVESVAPTEGYAPTEYSVDWSVTTAEGFDRANFSEAGYATMRTETNNSNNNNNNRNKGSRISSGNKLSCRSEKAVSVGPVPGPVKCIGSGEGWTCETQSGVWVGEESKRGKLPMAWYIKMQGLIKSSKKLSEICWE